MQNMAFYIAWYVDISGMLTYQNVYIDSTYNQ